MDATHPYSFSALGSHADYPFTSAGAGEGDYTTSSPAWPVGGPQWFTCAGSNGKDPRDFHQDTAETSFPGYDDHICDKETWWASLSPKVQDSARTQSTYDISGLSTSQLDHQIVELANGASELAPLAGPNVAGANSAARFACWLGRFGGRIVTQARLSR